MLLVLIVSDVETSRPLEQHELDRVRAMISEKMATRFRPRETNVEPFTWNLEVAPGSLKINLSVSVALLTAVTFLKEYEDLHNGALRLFDDAAYAVSLVLRAAEYLPDGTRGMQRFHVEDGPLLQVEMALDKYGRGMLSRREALHIINRAWAETADKGDRETLIRITYALLDPKNPVFPLDEAITEWVARHLVAGNDKAWYEDLSAHFDGDELLPKPTPQAPDPNSSLPSDATTPRMLTGPVAPPAAAEPQRRRKRKRGGSDPGETPPRVPK